MRDRKREKEMPEEENRAKKFVLLLWVVLNAFGLLNGVCGLYRLYVYLFSLHHCWSRFSLICLIYIRWWYIHIAYVWSSLYHRRCAFRFECCVCVCVWSGACRLPFPLWRRQQRENIFVLFYVGLDCVLSLNINVHFILLAVIQLRLLFYTHSPGAIHDDYEKNVYSIVCYAFYFLTSHNRFPLYASMCADGRVSVCLYFT